MDENQNQTPDTNTETLNDLENPMNQINTEPAQTETTPPMQQSADPSQMDAASGGQYGGFFTRLIAIIIDFVIVVFGITIITMPLQFIGIFGGSSSSSLTSGALGASSFLPFLIMVIYYVGMISYKGATLGKMAMGLRVQKKYTGENLSLVEAFLREVVGKFVSALVVWLGYFWMLWDKEKQTWHDKLAGSVVIKSR